MQRCTGQRESQVVFKCHYICCACAIAYRNAAHTSYDTDCTLHIAASWRAGLLRCTSYRTKDARCKHAKCSSVVSVQCSSQRSFTVDNKCIHGNTEHAQTCEMAM